VENNIETRYDPRRGQLFLWCGDQAFARLRDAVISETGVAQAIRGPATGVLFIEISVARAAHPPSRLRDRVTLLGCALVSFLLLFIFFAGVATIVGWLK
jgi:hypothetical protein